MEGMRTNRRCLSLHHPCHGWPAHSPDPSQALASYKPQPRAEGPLLLMNLNFTHKPRFRRHLLYETLPACCSILNILSSTHPCAVLY